MEAATQDGHACARNVLDELSIDLPVDKAGAAAREAIRSDGDPQTYSLLSAQANLARRLQSRVHVAPRTIHRLVRAQCAPG